MNNHVALIIISIVWPEQPLHFYGISLAMNTENHFSCVNTTWVAHNHMGNWTAIVPY